MRPPTPSTRSVDADQLGRDLVDAAGEELALELQNSCELGGLAGRLEQLAGAAAEIGEVDAAAGGVVGQPLGERERLVEQRRARCRLLPHVVQDRPLGARGDDRVGDALDPDERPLAAAAAVAGDRLERVDPVGARVLAEAEEDHPPVHAAIISASARAPASASATRSWSCGSIAVKNGSASVRCDRSSETGQSPSRKP